MRYCKSTSFQANHNGAKRLKTILELFAILQKYEFSSKSQLGATFPNSNRSCLRYCKSTSFQANHNPNLPLLFQAVVVCDTAKVRVFKQITTSSLTTTLQSLLFAILQKYEFSSKSQPSKSICCHFISCLRYCKSTSFQANHNCSESPERVSGVVCDTAKVRVFKQITTRMERRFELCWLFAILQKYEFSSKSQPFGVP